MSKDIILKIKAAEAEAEKLRNDAVEEAKARIRNAHASGKLLCENAEAEELRINNEKIRMTQEKADELLQRSQDELAASAKALEEECMPHMDEAVNRIIEGVIEQCR